jgi:hypothetical protein
MLTLYIDHSYFAPENNWTHIKDFLIKNPDIKLVVSDWNLIEIAQFEDKDINQKRLAFLCSFDPLWLIIKTEIQKFELQNFIYQKIHRSIYPYSPFASSFQRMVEIATSSAHSKVTPMSYVLDLMKRKDLLLPIEKSKKEYVENYDRIKKLTIERIKNYDDTIIASWLKDILPEKNPNGKTYSHAEKHHLINFCIQNKNDFIASCPYFQFENSLFELRYSQSYISSNRNPKPNDSIDLEHVCASVPYCDIVVIADNHLYNLVEKTNQNLGLNKTVVRCLSTI